MDNDITDSLSFGFHNPNHATGRLVREGDKTCRYGYLDKVLSVTDGKRSYRYAYHVDGQLARADYGDGGRAGVGEDGRAGSPLPAGSEAFLWDGLALVRRGDESFVNEPHVGDAPKKLRFGGKPRAKRSARRARKGPRGNPVVSSKGAAYFNDVLGTTVGVREGRGATRKGAKRRYTAAALTAFGEPVPVAATSHNSNIRQFDHSIISSPFFTGKPQVEGLGRVFLCRNYRADLAKWQTADPLGYPDGWNQLAYCGNGVTGAVDLFGAKIAYVFTEWICQYDPTGMGGYPLLDVFTFMKDKWDKGKQAMDILGIKTFNDFCDKMNEVLDDKVKEKLDKILDNGFWFDELLRADVASGGFSAYECTPPTEAEIIRVIGSGHEIYSVTFEKIDPDVEVNGSVRFVSGCTFKWKVVYE